MASYCKSVSTDELKKQLFCRLVAWFQINSQLTVDFFCQVNCKSFLSLLTAIIVITVVC